MRHGVDYRGALAGRSVDYRRDLAAEAGRHGIDWRRAVAAPRDGCDWREVVAESVEPSAEAAP